MTDTSKAIAAQLKGVPLFSSVSPKHRKAVARLGKRYTWHAGREGVRQESRAAAFYLILEGTVEITRDGSAIARLGPGDFFGEMALLSGGNRTASVTAVTECELFGLSRIAFAGAVEKQPKIALEVLSTMAERQSAL